MLKKLLLAAWIGGILFPMAWFSQTIPGFTSLFNRVFNPVWMHLIMHAGLYAVLAIGLVQPLRHRFGLILLAVLSVGLLQEGLQLLPSGRFYGAAELFDLAVDLAGASLGYYLYEWLRTKRMAAQRD